MRLLELLPNGSLRLTRKFIDTNIPPYAILSHTWGDDSDEVTFEDMVDGTGQDKAGFKKIQFCGKQEAQDGLQYFWVDSCCIRRSSDSELSESINSMFRWYQRAAVCYVYLSDLSVGEQDMTDSQSPWQSAFLVSRWFTRGWTLQELLAPVSVEFFSSDRKRIGDRKSLAQQIHDRTGIEVEALQGRPLSCFTIEQRIRWAANRTTKHEEDEAYSLVGIFEISMAPRYGEGKQNAFNRLFNKIRKASKKNPAKARFRLVFYIALTVLFGLTIAVPQQVEKILLITFGWWGVQFALDVINIMTLTVTLSRASTQAQDVPCRQPKNVTDVEKNLEKRKR